MYECMFCNGSSDSYIVKCSTYSEEEKVHGKIHEVEQIKHRNLFIIRET